MKKLLLYISVIVFAICSRSWALPDCEGSPYIGDKPLKHWHNCKGQHTFNDGDSYSGEWKMGLPNGIGIFTYDGKKYEGEFKDGNFHGKGVLTFSDGHVFYETEWINGEPKNEVEKRRKREEEEKKEKRIREEEEKKLKEKDRKEKEQLEAEKSKKAEQANDNIRLALDILNFSITGEKKSRKAATVINAQGCIFNINQPHILGSSGILYVNNILPSSVQFYSKQIYFLENWITVYWVEFSGDERVFNNETSGKIYLIDHDLDRIKKAWGLLFSKACKGATVSEF